MTHMDDSVAEELKISELLSGKYDYTIPIYQRNYAWREAEISQLIQDIIDYTNRRQDDKNYYLGTLVVFPRDEGTEIVFETIDGQQRLTTLSILASLINNEYSSQVNMDWFKGLNLRFDSREISMQTMTAIFRDNIGNTEIVNEAIESAYEICQKQLGLKLNQNDLTIKEFCDYLFNSVKILRVPLPENTDLNHYFEVMNNRGEQLEKHEVLKSKMMDYFNELDKETKDLYSTCFNQIWEACSNMEKYIHYGFTTQQRDAIFGRKDWNQLLPGSFKEVAQHLKSTKEDSINLRFEEVLEGKTLKIDVKEDEENPDRFNSVINFQNFLLHVLRVQTKKDIPLDDKRLIDIFEEEIKSSHDKVKFVKEFAYGLLRTKFLFDKYVIKREFIAGDDRWSLKRLKWYDGNKVSYVNTFGDEGKEEKKNRTILMLQSMFHVSTPTMVYKHWLNGILYYLYYNDKVISNNFIEYLESLAKTFVFDRFIAINPIDYYEMIYENGGTLKNDSDDLDLYKMEFGEIQNNLLFNYTDYLLWRRAYGKDDKANEFEFTFRSSVEHYYPQNPLEGQERLEEEYLHKFGNLCLISHSKNSKLSNYMPVAKKEHYKGNIDSMKQYLMMKKYDPKEWGEESIMDHDQKMKQILMDQLG